MKEKKGNSERATVKGRGGGSSSTPALNHDGSCHDVIDRPVVLEEEEGDEHGEEKGDGEVLVQSPHRGSREADVCCRDNQDSVGSDQGGGVTRHHSQPQQELPRGGSARSPYTHNLVEADEDSVDQSDGHHLLQILQGGVLIDLFNYEVGDELCNVLHSTQMDDPEDNGGFHTEQNEEIHCLG